MQQGDGSIEFPLGLLRAANGKVNRAQVVAGVLRDLASLFAPTAPQQDHHGGTGVEENPTSCG